MTDPWWFSGGDRLGDGDDAGAGNGSGTRSASREESASPGDGRFDSLHDLIGMLSGAPRMLSWALEAVMAPHAEHADPAGHPQCLLCRAQLLFADAGLPGFPASAGAAPDAGQSGQSGQPEQAAEYLRRAAAEPAMWAAEPIHWIPVRPRA